MHRLLVIFIILVALPFGDAQAATASTNTRQATKKVSPSKKAVAKKPKVVLPKNLVGLIAAEKENKHLWYVTPDKKERYYLKNETETQSVIEALKITIPTATITKIPKTFPKKKVSIPTTAKPYLGKLVATSDSELVWYVEPTTGTRISLGPPASWFGTLKSLAEVVPSKDVARYAMNKQQSLSIFDPLFSGVAFVAYDGLHFTNGSNDNRVLPLASLTKLMTALVVMDMNLDWSQSFYVSPEVINYPKNYYASGTSEVAFKAGDTVTLQDLRIALLVASSNQSADALARATGLTREEFLRRMNEKAELFGLTRTQFFDVAGLDTRNVSTPREMAVIAERAFANDLIATTSVTTDYTIIATAADGTLRPVPVVNRNTSLLAFAPEGAKSGYLVEAQRNAVIRKDGKIMIVMHAQSLTERNSILGKLVAAN